MRMCRRTTMWWLIGFGLSAGAVSGIVGITEKIPPWAWCGQVLHGGGPAAASHLAPAAVVLFFLFWTFVAALAILRRMLNVGFGPMPVARLVLDEAIRMRGVIACMALLLLVLALLPLTMKADTPLRYRLQSFLGYSLGVMELLLSLMTILLACQSVSGEMAEETAGSLFVKPLRRGSYLIGKWLGICLLDALLIGLGGAAVYATTVFWIARLQPLDEYDRMAVREEVLTARCAVLPASPISLDEIARRKLEQLRSAHPEGFQRQGGEAAVLQQLRDEVQTAWRSIGPFSRQSYIFRGLLPAKSLAQTLQLRYKMEMVPAPPDCELNLGFIVNGRSIPLTVVVGTAQVLPLPAALIDEQGQLDLTIVNVDPFVQEQPSRASLSFPADGLQILFRVGNFGPNLFRAVLILWAKLAFLCMLAVLAATFLSFPVACVACLAVWILAAGSGEVLDVLNLATDLPAEGVAEMPDRGFAAAAKAALTFLSQYSRLNAIAQIVDGRCILTRELLAHLGQIGLVWTGVCGVIAWLVFRTREIARVQV